MSSLHDEVAERQRAAQAFTDAYRRYCWNVASIEDVRLAPFHLLASESTRFTLIRPTSGISSKSVDWPERSRLS